MNREQMRYAQERLQRSYAVKRDLIAKECVIKAERKPPTLRQFRKMVEQGELGINNTYDGDETSAYVSRINRNTTISQLWHIDTLLERTDAKTDHDRLTKRIKALDEVYQAAMDELMLGDETVALKLIHTFNTKVF